MIADGRMRVDSLLSAHSTLDEAPGWFERLHGGERGLMKVMVEP